VGHVTGLEESEMFTTFKFEILKRKDHFRDPNVCDRIILKWMLKRVCGYELDSSDAG
jgi:hypothetical protein